MDDPELRRELLGAFEAEYREHLSAIRGILAGGAPLAGDALRDVFRRAHSLKGAARAVELPEVEAIAHELETLLLQAVDAGAPLPRDAVAIVRRGLDGIERRMQPDQPQPQPQPQPLAAAEPVPGRFLLICAEI